MPPNGPKMVCPIHHKYEAMPLKSLAQSLMGH